MLGEPGHGKSSLCMKMVSDFCERKFFPKEIKKVFSFSLNPTVWIKESENSLDIKNIFTLKNEEFKYDGKYQNIRLGKEHLKESLIFLDGYDELYLRLQEYSKTTIAFLNELKELAKDWNIKFIVTSRKTCINLLDLYKYEYRVCQLSKLTESKQKDWINDIYNTKLFPEDPYDVEEMYTIHQMNSVQSKVLELLEIPILLQLIVSKHFYGDAQNIVELYDKLFIKILTTRNELVIDPFDEDRTEEFKQIFKSYAYDIYKNNDTYAIIKSEELKKKENTKWKSLLLFYLKSQKSTQQREYYIEFIHRSFYQYFQAWYFYNLVLEIIKEKKQKKKKEKIDNLFEAIHCKEIERDVIDMIGQINENQKDIQEQEQIECILNIFEKSNGLDEEKTIIYNLLMALNIIMPNGLIISKYKRIAHLIKKFSMVLNIITPNRLIISKYKKIAHLIKKFDMSEIYLPKIVLLGLNLSKISLESANLKEANLENANLESANLELAHLEKCHLKETNLEGAHLRWAHLENAHLENAYLDGADLREAHLKGTYLKWAYLKYASLKEANLENANLEEANLKNTDLIRTHLESVNLKKADLENAHLIRAHLEGANLEEADLTEANLTWANLTLANLTWTNLEEADLTEANLGGANLGGANLTRANLIRADLTETNLGGANLTWANLTWANLTRANLTRANLTWANLEGANLTRAYLIRADFNPSILKETILENTKISREKYNEIIALGIDTNGIVWWD